MKTDLESKMKEDRNLTTHTYDENTAEDLFMCLPEHAALLTGLTRALKPRAKSAFTLVELLVVIAIIGILVGTVVGISGFANRKAANSRALADMEIIKSALEEFRIEYGQYFTNAETQTQSSPMQITTLTDFSNRVGQFAAGGLKIVDPWGRGYFYTTFNANPALSYRLYSEGASTSTSNDNVDASSAAF